MEKIKKEIRQWAKDNLGADFKFRENQIECIAKLVFEKTNGICPNHIIQAPTGSGKSLINIISAGVLWQYYGKKSYLLASDLYLYQQYVDFIEQYNLSDFAYLKGQTGNYFCVKSKSDMRNCACKMAGISYGKLFSIMDGSAEKSPNKSLQKLAKNFSCAKSCPYLIERLEAVEAPITLMTYHLFYFQMNVCDKKIDSHGHPIPGQFLYRDYIFCDECHNIPSIMQQRCRPAIKHDDIIKLKKIFNYYKLLKKDPSKIKIFQQINEAEMDEIFKTLWGEMMDKTLDSYHNTIILMKYYSKIISKIGKIGNRIQSMFGTKIKNGVELNPKEKEIYGDITWLQNYTCYIGDFCRAIDLTGYHYTYKQICPGKIVNFGCVKEDGIIYSFLLKWAMEGTTLCSATIGNIEAFIENCGYKHFENDLNKKVKFLDIPSNFDFSESPIYLDYEDKMTFAKKHISIIPITKKINKLMEIHKNENGIIQSGSYENAQMIYKYLSVRNKRRALVYKNSEEKKKYIKLLNKNSNYVIIGPSLNEGIDLPGDLCNFIIIAKVPYLSMGDKYVVTKMKIFKKWYNDTAMNNIIQGIGRGNRFQNDKSKIYILDGAFKRLFSYTKKFWPDYITNRFINININELYKSEGNKSSL